MIKAVIFDFDGVLVHSEPVKMQAAIQTFQSLGLPLSEAEIQTIPGRSFVDFIPEFLATRGIHDATMCETTKTNHKHNYDILWPSIVTLCAGVPEVITALQAQQKQLAIVTMNRRKSIEQFFTIFGFQNAFSVVVTREDITQRKPNPEVYTTAVEKLGLLPEECLAVEDTRSGVAAAISAGLTCVAIPNEYSEHENFSQAQYHIQTLHELLALV